MRKFFTLCKALLFLPLLLVTLGLEAQTNPAPVSLPYTQNFSSLTGTSPAYPAGFQGWTVAGSLGTSYNTTGALTDFAIIATTNANTSAFVGDMTGKLGILSTASNMKAIGMAINTTNFTNVAVTYTAATQRQLGTERLDELGVQCRVGTTGAFINITGSTYQNNVVTPNTTGTTAINPAVISFTLPAACNNQPVVQIRWIIRDISGSGGRPGYSIDDVSVSGTGTTPVTSSVSPTSIAAGSAAFSLTVNGSSFSNASFVTWNGSARSTTYVNDNQLIAVIPASDIAVQGTAAVGVTTTGVPASSNTQTFTINAAATPSLLVTSPLADFGSVCLSGSPVVKSFSLSASNLDGSDVIINALNGFTYAETAGGTYTGNLHLTYTGGAFNKTVFVKFTPTAVQSYDGNIVVNGGGVADVNVPATASGINTTASVVTGSNVVTGTSASLNGNINSNGCTAITAYGFEYSTTAGFTPGSGVQVTSAVLNAGAFSKTVTGLVASTTYYYRAFAVNGGGTAYGNESTFTTSSVVPVVMASQPLLRYTENFNDISNWSANFTSGVGANHFSAVTAGGSAAIPSATRITTSSAAFSSGSSGGVQKGSGALVLLSTGSTDNSSSVAVDFYMDFTGVNAGTLSFDWTAIANSTGDRKGSLRVYGSTDGVTFTELTSADVLNFTNNVPATGTVNNIALPASFGGNPSARLRFYYHNGTGGTTGSRPKISIDNLSVTAVPSVPCATPTAAASSMVFSSIGETSISGSFTAASPAANEYLVIMSTSPSLTNNPLDGQTYVIGDNVGDGTVIAKGNDLSFTATDLTGATTYYFFVYSVNSVCTGGPKYLTTDVLTEDATTVAGLPSCTAPVSQPTGFTATAGTNSVQGSFTAAVGADEYIVLQSASATFTGALVNGTSYNAGNTVGNATVVQRSNATSFTANGLAPQTQYYYFIFAINSQGCVNGPVYNTTTPLTGSATTSPLPVCATPTAQPSDISFNSSNSSVTATFNAAGAGYNYLVIMSSSPALSATPVDNTDYSAGTAFGGGTVVSNGTSTSFIATGLNSSTTYYFFVFSANKNCTGGTKYLTASPLTGSATTTNAPANNYYFGNLHAHTDYSDGQKDNPGGTPMDAYNYAMASMGMDFLGISEHNHFSTLNNPGNQIANYHMGSQQAAAFNASHSNFLALYGMEWGVISGGGHVVVYGDGLTELFGWESNVNGTVGPNYDVYVPKSTYLGVEGLFARVNDYVAKNAFASLAHPNNADYNNLSNIPYDQSADDAISGVAVESGPATSSNTTYSNPSSMSYLWYFQKLLSKGYHLGPMIDHDNHNTTFGRHTPARTAVIAPELTQSALMKAIRDMHFYATEDMDAKVDFTINTRIMGSVFEDRNAPSIAVNLTDATNSTSNALIRVMYGEPGSNTNAVVIDSVFGSSLSYVDNALANHATGYYYIDITNEGKRIVTSPIWYTRTCASASDTTANVCGSFNWYGTVYTTSATATKVFSTTGGCDSTVTLHLTISSGPSSATLAVAGSGSGCPGTGVGLTASVVDGGTITSYEWVKDGNITATTNSGSYTATTSGTYTVTAYNAAHCSAGSNSVTVTVSDDTPPTPTVAGLPTITGSCAVTVPAAPTATDNCAGTVTGTTTDPLTYTTQGTFTIHWTYTDGNGNTTTQEQTVIVSDTEKPTITAPAAVSVVNDAGQCGATINNIGTPVTADNCGVATVSNDHPSAFYPVGTTTVTWKVTDVNGNVTDTATQTVTVIDNEEPTITAQNISVNNTPGNCSATVVLPAPVTHDNCGVVSVTNDHPSTTFAVGTTVVTWTVTDNAGWTVTATQNVTVTDNQPPTVTAPSEISVVNDAGQCGATIANIGTPVVNDNCGVASITNDHPSAYYPVGTTIVKWIVTDIHGNVTDTATQKVTVIDNELPTVTVTNVSIAANAGCGANVTLVAPAASDNCGVASVTNNHPSSFFPIGNTNVVWTVTDNNGWTNTATQVVTVLDQQAPTVITQSVTVNLDAGGNATVTAAQVNNGSSDNCSIGGLSLSKTHFTCANIGANTVVLTVTDASGNSASANAVVTVVDNIAPTVTTQPITINLNAAGTATITASQLIAASSDNCGVSNVSASKTSFSCSNLGANNVTVTVTDASGNTTTANAVVTVKDNSAPTVTTQPLTVYLDASGSVAISASQLVAASNDNCGISSVSASKTNFNCSNLGTNTIIVTVTDASGNTTTANAVVTVKDNTAPVITAVPAQAFCTNGSGYTIPTLGATDNCSAVTTSYAITGATVRSGTGNNASGAFNAGVSTITWTVKDASGNAATSTTTVTVSGLPATTISLSSPDAFCNKLTLTANTTAAGATYKWTSGSAVLGTSQTLSLGQSNGDGVYQVTVTINGCTSAPATYNYQKQTILSSYTMLAFDKIDLGSYNIVASGSVGVTGSKGEVELGSFSTINSPGSFVKAKNIDKAGLFISIANPVYAPATGITLPTMIPNTANANNLSNKDVAQNSVSTVSGNYKNLTLKKGSRTTLTGNTFGSIRVEQGAQVTFTAPTINIDKLEIVKGPRTGYSYIRFTGDAKVLVSTSVSIGSQVFINPDNNNVTFYMGDKKSDDERFVVNGGDTKINANIYMPKGKLKVTGGYSYGMYGLFGLGDCDVDFDDDRWFGLGNSYVNMTGTFIAENIVGNGKNVIWNSFDCSASPVPVMNYTPAATANAAAEKTTIATTEEDLKVTVLPNPTSTYFSLKIESKYNTPVNLRVMDSRGRVVDSKSKVGANSTIQVGHKYASGTYFAELIQGSQRKVVQLIKVRG